MSQAPPTICLYGSSVDASPFRRFRETRNDRVTTEVALDATDEPQAPVLLKVSVHILADQAFFVTSFHLVRGRGDRN